MDKKPKHIWKPRFGERYAHIVPIPADWQFSGLKVLWRTRVPRCPLCKEDIANGNYFKSEREAIQTVTKMYAVLRRELK